MAALTVCAPLVQAHRLALAAMRLICGWLASVAGRSNPSCCRSPRLGLMLLLPDASAYPPQIAVRVVQEEAGALEEVHFFLFGQVRVSPKKNCI